MSDTPAQLATAMRALRWHLDTPADEGGLLTLPKGMAVTITEEEVADSLRPGMAITVAHPTGRSLTRHHHPHTSGEGTPLWLVHRIQEGGNPIASPWLEKGRGEIQQEIDQLAAALAIFLPLTGEHWSRARALYSNPAHRALALDLARSLRSSPD